MLISRLLYVICAPHERHLYSPLRDRYVYEQLLLRVVVIAAVSDFVCAFAVDDVALLWINGTKTIMTDTFPSSLNPRVKPGPRSESSSGSLDNTLIIEQVTRWDSGPYTCKITSTPPVVVTHTLHVTRQYSYLPGLLNYTFYGLCVLAVYPDKHSFFFF